MSNIEFHAFKTRNGGWRVRITLDTRGVKHWYTTECDSLGEAIKSAALIAKRETGEL